MAPCLPNDAPANLSVSFVLPKIINIHTSNNNQQSLKRARIFHLFQWTKIPLVFPPKNDAFDFQLAVSGIINGIIMIIFTVYTHGFKRH